MRESESFDRAMQRALRFALPPLVLGHERIRDTGQGRFEYAEHGTEATLVEVEDRDGLPWDIVAWTKSESWMLRKGCGVLLGAPYLDYCEAFYRKLPVYETPQSWLDSGGRGVCILNWSAPIPELLWNAPAHAFESDELRQRYWGAVEKYAPPAGLLP